MGVSGWLFLLQQTTASWSLLVTLGACMGLHRPHWGCVALTALWCGGAALLGAMVCGALLRAALLLGIAVLAPMGAWPHVPRCRRLGMCLCCLVLSVLMAGCARLLHMLGLSHTPLLLAQCLLLPVLVRLAPAANRNACVLLEITNSAARLELTALVDSGNLLRDPITRLPVIVVSRQTAAKLLPGTPPMRLISVRTVAGSALMPVFRPDLVRVLLPQGWQTVQTVVGLSPDGYSGFQALMPASVISRPSQGGISVCL